MPLCIFGSINDYKLLGVLYLPGFHVDHGVLPSPNLVDVPAKASRNGARDLESSDRYGTDIPDALEMSSIYTGCVSLISGCENREPEQNPGSSL
jgi:hypothetical protein